MTRPRCGSGRHLLVVSGLLVAGLGVPVLLGACALPVQRREDSLMRTAREFNDGLRWGRDDTVLPCLAPTEAKGLLARKAALGDDLVMADQEVKSVKFQHNDDDGADRATVVAELSWFNQRHGIVRRSTIEQQWAWNDSHWMLASWRRVAGDRFPLVPEPLSAGR